MPVIAPTYDLVLMLDPAADDDQRKKVLTDVEQIFASNSATIVGTHDWGVRRMTFEIRHKADAEYHLIQFQGPPALPAALNRYLRIADAVIRFRVVKLAPGTPPPPAKQAEAAVELEAVAGDTP